MPYLGDFGVIDVVQGITEILMRAEICIESWYTV